MRRYTLTARVGAKVSHERYDDLAAALDDLERRGHTLQGVADADSVGGSLMRQFEPQHQVTARLELHGPRRLHVGVDIHGDGSAVPFTGRIKRRQVERDDGETAYDALRRAVAE